MPHRQSCRLRRQDARAAKAEEFVPRPSIALARRLDRSTDPTMSASRPRQVDIPTVPPVPAHGEHTRRLSPFRERSSTTSPAPTSGSGTSGSVGGRVVRSPERTGASAYAAERRMREKQTAGPLSAACAAWMASPTAIRIRRRATTRSTGTGRLPHLWQLPPRCSLPLVQSRSGRAWSYNGHPS